MKKIADIPKIWGDPLFDFCIVYFLFSIKIRRELLGIYIFCYNNSVFIQ